MSNDDVFDRAIDEVARDLTAGAPRAVLAARVRRRLEAQLSRERAWVWQRAGAAAAVLALVAYLLWPVEHGQSTAQVARTPASAPSSASRKPAPETAQAPSVPAPVVARAAARPAPVRRSQPEPRMRIPIDADAPQLAAIPEPPDLTVEPIEIAELTIPPLEPEKESR